MQTTTDALEKIRIDGFYLCRQLVDEDEIESLICGLDKAKDGTHARIHDGETYALRNILQAVPEVLESANNEALLSIVRSVLGPLARPVKAILFDKTAKVNWHLRWHQDSVISVAEKRDAPGFSGWSMKVGVPHVRPPVEILEQMLAARIHIDECATENGALKVIPQSHAHGRLSNEQIREWKAKGSEVFCGALKGDVLFMKPLLLHSSERSKIPKHRRVLHIEYAGCDLPHGLEWGV